METKTRLDEMPGMDQHKIGPGGQTFGELRQAVRATRAAYTDCPCSAHLGGLEAAVRMLRAAYVRVGLPYKAP